MSAVQLAELWSSWDSNRVSVAQSHSATFRAKNTNDAANQPAKTRKCKRRAWCYYRTFSGLCDILAWRKSQTLEKNGKKTGSFSLIERVILSAGAMLIFSVSFQIDQMPEGNH